MKIILIKYGELTTKKDNRKEFINILSKNINEKISKYDAKIVKDRSRMYIVFDDKYKNQIIDVLSNTFGIHAFNIVYKANTNNDAICNEVLNRLSNITFKYFINLTFLYFIISYLKYFFIIK